MKKHFPDLLCLILIGGTFVTAAWLYADLPDNIPSHWNAQGEVDGYLSKPWGAFLLPLIMLGTYGLLWVAPLISPQGFRMEQFRPVLALLRLAITATLSVVSLAMLFFASGLPINITAVTMGSTGILFIVLGNYLGKVRKNFFLGIRTPWTLASDEVWVRTHRLGGWLFVLAGLVIFSGVFVILDTSVFIVVISIVAIVPIIYSFVIYRQIEGFKDGP